MYCTLTYFRPNKKSNYWNWYDCLTEKNVDICDGKNGKPTDLEVFTGFKPAIEGCMLDWESYPIPGVTYGHNSHYLAPFAVFKLDPQKPDDQSSQINSSQAVLRCEYPTRPRSRVQSLGTISCEDREEKQSLQLRCVP